MIELILAGLIGTAHAQALGVEQGRVTRYSVTRVGGDGRDLTIDSVDPRVIQARSGAAPAGASVTLKLTSAPGKSIGFAGADRRGGCQNGAAPNTHTCVISFAHLPAGDWLKFNVFAVSRNAVLPGPSDSNYQVQLPIVRVEAVRPALVRPHNAGSNR